MTLTVADTAYSIAAIRADEHELFEDPYAKHFAASGAHAEEGTRRYLSLPFFATAFAFARATSTTRCARP
ncbi:MAG TPA: hypothetical protein VGH87_28800 [Polyangiaceae bacterium]|jgi:hypothetical protein